jgi:hypothetical protein
MTIFIYIQLKKLLEGIFSPKSLYLTIKKDIECLLELLWEQAQ